jgi:transposase
MLLLSRKEKEGLVIKLAREGKTTREIAKIVHISLKDIGEILRKVNRR